MTAKNDDPSRPLRKEKHEAFATHYAVNGNAAQAWLAATAGNPAHSDVNGSKWKSNGSIRARVAWLKAEAERLLSAKHDDQQRPVLLTIMEKRQFCARLLRAKATELPADSDLWQGIEQGKEGLKFRLPSKLDAIKLDNDLAGDGSDAAAADALTELLARLQ